MRLLRKACKAYGILGEGILIKVDSGNKCVRTDTKRLSPSDTKKRAL